MAFNGLARNNRYDNNEQVTRKQNENASKISRLISEIKRSISEIFTRLTYVENALSSEAVKVTIPKDSLSGEVVIGPITKYKSVVANFAGSYTRYANASVTVASYDNENWKIIVIANATSSSSRDYYVRYIAF